MAISSFTRPRLGRGRALPAAALVVYAAIGSPAWAGQIRVTGESLPCPEVDLPQAVAPLVAQQMDGRPDVTVELQSPLPGSLTVRIGEYQRSFPFQPSECEELPQTLALLVRGWLNRGWTELPIKAPPVVPVAPPQPVVEAGPSIPHISLYLLGAGYANPPSSRMYKALAGGVGWNHSEGIFGLALEGGLKETLAKRVVGQVLVRPYYVGLLGRYRLRLATATELELRAGPAVEWLDVRTSGFSPNASMRFGRPVLLGGIHWRLGVLTGLWLVLSTGIEVREREDRFLVDSTPVVTVPAARLVLGAGLMWEPW